MQAQYKTYDSYKDSGVPWLGEIPEEWEAKRLQFVASHNDDVLSEKTLKEKVIKYIDISSVDSATGSYSYEEHKFKNSPSRARRVVQNGDTIISTVRTYLKAIALIKDPEQDLIVSTGFAVIRPRKEINTRYLGYSLQNDLFVSEIVRRSVGTSYPAITANDLVKIETTLPPLDEQNRIATFLDQKAVEIDTAIEKKQRLIELLKEQKSILINQAVTKGLNPNAPMKNSGIEWIGNIPAHWKVKRAKYFFREIDERSKTGDEELLSVSHVTGVTLRSEKNIFMFMAEDYAGSKLCDSGDLVFNIMWAWMGALGVSDRTGIVSPSYGVYRSKKPHVFNNWYLEELLRSLPYVTEYNKRSTGLHSSRLRLYSHMFFAMEIAVPPIEEQAKIEKEINIQCDGANKVIIATEKEIEKLKEFKRTLIAHAVTGKIKV